METEPVQSEAEVENTTPVAGQVQPEGEVAQTEETPPETEAKADAGEGEKPTEEAKPETEEAKAEKHKRAGGWQRRIERQERQIQQLTEALARTAPPQPGSTSGTPQPKTAEQQAVDYIREEVARGIREAEAHRERSAKQSEFQRKTAEVRAQNPDFDEVVMSADLPVSDAVRDTLLTSDQGPAIMYELAKSPAELARISALPPLEAAREIGRLEARFTSSTPGPTKPKPAVRPPAPPTSVNGGTKSTRSLEDLPIAEYKRAIRSGQR